MRTQSGLEAARAAASAEDGDLPDAAGATHEPESAAPTAERNPDTTVTVR